MRNFTQHEPPPLPLLSQIAQRKDVKNHAFLLRVLRALHNKKFLFNVEPIYCACEKAVEFREILLRLYDKNGKLMPASDVFGTVCENNLSADVGLYLLYYQLRFRHILAGTVSVNVNTPLLSDPKWRQKFWHLLSVYAAKGQADKVILEVLEREPLPITPELITFMQNVKALGYRWALDDFGGGFHTFDHIHHLPISYVKLCAISSKRLAKTPTLSPFERDVVNACKKHSLPMVAEAIRTPEQRINLYKWHGIRLSQTFDMP